MVQWPFQGVSDLQLGDEKVTFESSGLYLLLNNSWFLPSWADYGPQECFSGFVKWSKDYDISPNLDFPIIRGSPLLKHHLGELAITWPN